MAVTDGDTRRNRDQLGRTNNADVGTIERVVSAAGGGALALFGVSRRSPAGAALALAGGYLIYRGATGRCQVYSALGINTARTNRGPRAVVQHKEGVKVTRSVTVNRPPVELYRFWRDFRNLPRVMSHLQSVTVIDDKRSHWVVRAPFGRTVEWDAIVTDDRPDERIAWKSADGADVRNTGAVEFLPAPGDRGTEVRATIAYEPPAGQAGRLFAKLWGEEPGKQAHDDLRRLKQFLETGEIPTPALRRADAESAAPDSA